MGNINYDKNTLFMMRGATLEDIGPSHYSASNEGATISTTVGQFRGGSAYFNGSSRILFPSFNFLNSDWTIDWWEYPTAAANGARFCSSYTTNTGTCGGLLLGYRGTAVFASTVAEGSSWDLISNATMLSVTANTWTHWAFVKQGTTLTSYRNGVQFAQVTMASSSPIGYSSSIKFSIGDYRLGDHSHFIGYLDMLRISKGVRWTSNFVPPNFRRFYIGKNNVSRPIKKTYIGINNQARPVKKIYIGVDNKARLIADASPYTVTFNANGGSGSTATAYSETSFAPVKSVKLTSNGFSRSGYQFLGWNTAANGNGTVYTNGSTISISSNTTLYAQWLEVTTITWRKNRSLNEVADVVQNWAGNMFYTGPITNGSSVSQHYLGVAISLANSSIWSKYGASFPTQLDFSQRFGESGAESSEHTAWRTVTVPKGSVMTVYAKNHYVGNISGFEQKAEIYLNGASVTTGTSCSYNFTLNSAASIDAQWDMSGTPAVSIGGYRAGASWWDVSVSM